MEYEHLQSSCKHHIWGGATPYSKIYGKDDYQTWKTATVSKKNSVHKISRPLKYCKTVISKRNLQNKTKLSILGLVQHLIIRNWLVASMTTETFWMPNSSHATQESSMANFTIATSTNSTQEEICQVHETCETSVFHRKNHQLKRYM